MEQLFRRDFESLNGIFAFIDAFFERERIDRKYRYGIFLAAEELFTNMIKYGGAGKAGSDIRVEIARVDNQLQLALTDYDADPFDVTKSSPVPKDTPLEQRRRGGLGLQIIREMMDSVTYEHDNRRSRIVVIKKVE